ncbi:MAG: hypothetical protein ABL997_16285 [Planctomycetota bacterium]
MNRYLCAGWWLAPFALAFGGCCTIEVTPLVENEIALGERPVLHVNLSATVDPSLLLRTVSQDLATELDGEDLAVATDDLRAAFALTDAFASVVRGRPGQGLHCELRLRSFEMVHFGALFFEVTAPGRTPRTYTVVGRGDTWLWLPLLPIGLVQSVTQRSAQQQTVDGLVAQMARDGWLAGYSKR